MLSVMLLWMKRERSAELVEAVESRGEAVITTSWLLPGEFACLQAEGIPVVMADRSGTFLVALDALSDDDPVVVCLERDLQTTLSVMGESSASLRIDAVVPFDPSMRVAVITF